MIRICSDSFGLLPEIKAEKTSSNFSLYLSTLNLCTLRVHYKPRKKETIDWNFCELRILKFTIEGFWICSFILKTIASKHCWIAFRTFQSYKFVSMALNRSFTIKWHSPLNLYRQDTFRELFISTVKSRLTSVNQIFTNGKSVKTIQQSNDLIGLESNCRLKKLTYSNTHNTLKQKYFEYAILKYAIHCSFSLSLFVSWEQYFYQTSIISTSLTPLGVSSPRM